MYGYKIGLKSVGSSAIAPTNSVAPVISGTAVVGQTLTSTTGTWAGVPTPTFSYQWKRGVTNVGTNANTYTLVSADAGQSITCVVTGTNAAGSANATSNALTVLATTLDIYPTASSAYSVRLLRGARYDNALIRARRSSDNAEVDVFVDSNFELSLNSNITSRTSGTTLATWVGANSAFVTKWYDQSGNSNDAVQATSANQPTIVASGVLQTNLGKAALLFNGTMSLQATVNWTNLFATYTVAKLNSLAPAVQAFYRDNGSVNSTGAIAFNSSRVDSYRVRTSVVTLSTTNAEFGTTTKLLTLSSDASNGYAYLNNNLRASNAVSGNVGTIMYIGSNGAGNTGGIVGPMSEWITYPSNSNLTAINNSINTYYSIYPIVSDTDAQAFIEATGIDSTTQANAINTLVISLKGQSLWTNKIASYPFVGGTADSHKYNLKNSLNTDAAFRLAFFGTVTHTANGVQGNGVNGYANTFIFDNLQFTGNEFTVVWASRTNSTTGFDFGITNSTLTGGIQGASNSAGNTISSAFGPQVSSGALSVNTQARFILTKRGTTVTLMRNGVVLFTRTELGNLRASRAIPLFCRGYINTSATDLPSNREYSYFAFINGAITVGQEASYDSILNTYMNSLSR